MRDIKIIVKPLRPVEIPDHGYARLYIGIPGARDQIVVYNRNGRKKDQILVAARQDRQVVRSLILSWSSPEATSPRRATSAERAQKK